MANKGPFLEKLRFGISGTGIQTVETDSVNTPISKTEDLAMLIHKIYIKGSEPVFSAGIVTVHEFCINDESHVGDAAMPEPDDGSVIYRVDRFAQEGILAATFGRGQTGPMQIDFSPPLLYAKSQIHAEVRRTAVGAGLTEMNGWIGYTLEKVSRDDFISSLVE